MPSGRTSCGCLTLANFALPSVNILVRWHACAARGYNFFGVVLAAERPRPVGEAWTGAPSELAVKTATKATEGSRVKSARIINGGGTEQQTNPAESKSGAKRLAVMAPGQALQFLGLSLQILSCSCSRSFHGK